MSEREGRGGAQDVVKWGYMYMQGKRAHGRRRGVETQMERE